MLLKYFFLCLLLQVAACTTAPPAVENDGAGLTAVDNAWTRTSQTSSTAVAPVWQHSHFPGKQATQYLYAHLDGREAMAVNAVSSASMLRQKIRVSPHDLGSIRFSWKVPELMAEADLGLREADDSPVRIVLAFEGDRSTFSAKNSMLSELSHAITGEPLPYATLMYVWCNTCAPGSVIVNPRTDRIRALVVESGRENLNQWLDYRRDIRADFEMAFGERAGALVGIGIMTDSDNTHSTTRAWYGQLRLASTFGNAEGAKHTVDSVITTR